ncbi:MAG: thiamine-monophosphate kinase [Oceanicoccus sp.]|jgi:thiamine-monophosphate kinase
MSSRDSLTEFKLIAQFFANIGPTSISPPVTARSSANAVGSSVALSVGDDCAVLNVEVGKQLVLSIDTLVADRHFPSNASPYDIARRALAVSVSDLAAMGATPLAFTLALTLPQVNTDWLQPFSDGLDAAAKEFDIALIGGDTTAGPLTITLQVHGTVTSGNALRRSTAQAGDSIFVTGSLGDAAAALALIEQRLSANKQQQQFLLSRYYQPTIHLGFAQAITGIATAAIDISDGLLADLGHIATASDLSALINSAALPLSPTLQELVTLDQAVEYAACGGDDYELCFTAPAKCRQQILACAERFSVPVTELGQMVVAGNEAVFCLDSLGESLVFNQQGYQHFE